jgi:ketopantoate reductase
MPDPIRIERIDGDRQVDSWETPVVASALPADTDVIVVTVRAEQLDAALDSVLDGSRAPIVVLTPMLPQDFERLRSKYGARLRAGMAGVVGYVNDAGTCRYWLPRLGATLVDEAPQEKSSRETASVADLVHSLVDAGIPTRFELGVHEQNPATTVVIAPFSMGIDAGGSIDALLHDDALLKLTLTAVREGLSLSTRIGESATWMKGLMPYVGKRMLRIGASIVKSRWPEIFSYVEAHFGRKLHAQNIAMGRAIVELAEAKGMQSAAIAALLAQLESSPKVLL